MFPNSPFGLCPGSNPGHAKSTPSSTLKFPPTSAHAYQALALDERRTPFSTHCLGDARRGHAHRTQSPQAMLVCWLALQRRRILPQDIGIANLTLAWLPAAALASADLRPQLHLLASRTERRLPEQSEPFS